MRSLGVRLATAVNSDFDDLLLSGVGVACGSFETGWRSSTACFCGVFMSGSGSSGSDGSSRCGEEAVCQLSLDLMDVSAGVVDR